MSQYIPLYSQTSNGWKDLGENNNYAVNLDVGINEYTFSRPTPNNDFIVSTGLVNDNLGIQMVGGVKSIHFITFNKMKPSFLIEVVPEKKIINIFKPDKYKNYKIKHTTKYNDIIFYKNPVSYKNFLFVPEIIFKIDNKYLFVSKTMKEKKLKSYNIDTIYIGDKIKPSFLMEVSPKNKIIKIYKPDKYSKNEEFYEKYTLGKEIINTKYDEIIYIKEPVPYKKSSYSKQFIVSEIIIKIHNKYLYISKTTKEKDLE